MGKNASDKKKNSGGGSPSGNVPRRSPRRRDISLPTRKMTRSSLSAYMNWPVFLSVGLLGLCVAVTAVDWYAGIAASLVSAVTVVCLFVLTWYYTRRIASDLVDFGAGYSQIQKQLLQEMSIPYAIADENGLIIWTNDEFSKLTGLSRNPQVSLFTLFPETEGRLPGVRHDSVIIHASYKEQKIAVSVKATSLYEITDSVLSDEENRRTAAVMYGIWLSDETEMLETRQKLEDDRMVIALIYIDNYQEAMESIEEVRRSLLLAVVDRQISKYITNYQGVIRRLENDKYLAIFTKSHLREMQANNFSFIEDVKHIDIGNTTAMTISMGIGLNGGSYEKNYEYCRGAIDMALGRGGDQVVLRDGDNISYYGGKSQGQGGPNSMVRARVKAQSLRELIEAGEDVLIMGHQISDADCIGSAVGICRAAAYSGHEAHIVLDFVSNNIKPLVNLFENRQKYPEELFVNNRQAKEMISDRTVLVLVDNSRPGRCECPELLDVAKNVVVIDHHRQARDSVENSDLSYIEPYASSASEMVAELLQYYAEDIDILPEEAEAMYSGIIVDTNNFITKTGVRTFEAAAFLRRNGADVTRVRKMFRDDISDYRAKAEIIRNAEIYRDRYAIGICPAGITESPTVIASQAANELLGIRNIRASFVLTDYEHQIYISARSIDELNVQIVMEKMGGGGHLSIAGAQLKNTTIEEAVVQLKTVLNEIEQTPAPAQP